MAAGGARPPLPASILGDMGQALALVSPSDGRLLYVNPACERLFGYEAGTLDEHHLSEVSAAPARSPGDRAVTIAREIAGAGVWTGESEGVRADGSTFACIVSLSEIEDAALGGRVWVAVFLAGQGPPAAKAPARRFRIVFDPRRVAP
jgi:PAS domain S-box-containing protein